MITKVTGDVILDSANVLETKGLKRNCLSTSCGLHSRANGLITIETYKTFILYKRSNRLYRAEIGRAMLPTGTDNFVDRWEKIACEISIIGTIVLSRCVWRGVILNESLGELGKNGSRAGSGGMQVVQKVLRAFTCLVGKTDYCTRHPSESSNVTTQGPFAGMLWTRS